MITDSHPTFSMSKYPAIRVAILLGFGIGVGNNLDATLWLVSVILLAVIAIRSWLDRKNRIWLRAEVTRLTTLLFLFSIVLVGTFLINFSKSSKVSEIEKVLEVSAWEQVEINAVVENEWRNSAGKQRADITVIQTFISEIKAQQSFKARLLLNNPENIQPGDTITFSATLIPVGEKRNPYQFDYKKYLLDQEIRIQVRLDSLISTTINSDKANWYWWRAHALRLIEYNFSADTAPIAKALLLGYKQDLEGETRKAFARSGLSHIMAVSGLHVGFIVAPFWIIIPFFWTNKQGRLIGLILLGIILFCYSGLTGFSTSVMRASIMAVLFTFGKLYNKAPNSINLTGVAAIIVLVIDPLQLFEIGFQLSFSAVLVILLVLPVVQRALPYWLRVRWYAVPLMTIIVSFIVQLGLYPLQVYYFGEVSLIGPFANALFVPLLGLTVPLSLLCVLISSAFPILGFWLNIPSDFFLRIMNEFVLYSSGQSWVWTHMDLQSLLLFPLWISAMLVIACWRMPKLKWKWLILSLLLVSVVKLESIFNELKPKDLVVTVFDVGQGDASLIETPNGKTVLIDTGVWNPGYNSGESVILPHLKAKGIDKLDAVILSHPHSDHIGGIVSLLNTVEVEVIYNSGYEYDSGLYRRYIENASKEKVKVEQVKSGEYLEIDPSVLFLVLGPEPISFGGDPNEHSVVVNLIHGSTEFLFTGDAGKEQEERLIKNYGEFLDIDFLKVGHHGSRTSSGEGFLNYVTPEIAVTSLGEQNRFGHPHYEAVSRLMETGSELYFTSRDKALVFKSDGRNIQRVEWDK
ncbi:MAG: DNA internalization-related competence protein ComEC/Rec2 [Balneola sp.]|nr:MAG: DNA internalization-related competence protein ComEC/Rec2 [Balneola sp.]